MDGFFRIFKKAVSELICTRLYVSTYLKMTQLLTYLPNTVFCLLYIIEINKQTNKRPTSLILLYITGKSLSEALILVSTNPQYDDRLFIELPVQYMKIASSERSQNMWCTQIVFCFCFDIQNNLCSESVLSL